MGLVWQVCLWFAARWADGWGVEVSIPLLPRKGQLRDVMFDDRLKTQRAEWRLLQFPTARFRDHQRVAGGAVPRKRDGRHERSAAMQPELSG